MPGKVGVKIKAGRNLPVMDRGSDTTDAYVEIKLGTVTHKTDVCRKSLNPQWNTDWFRFEVDDAELQDEPLQIRLMDYDTYSANDAIGKVNISLNPLCWDTSGQTIQGKGTVLSGWIPVFDTMHGIRGEVNVIVKVDLFSDLNKFRQSSCGIQFFHSPCIPHGYRAQVIHGFVEELVVNDDPEYQWIDKIRTPRASNEARQVVFLKLSGQVQRKMGLKAMNMGANAVVGYAQCFDLEGDVGVVARGIGTAITLIKDTNQPSQPTANDNVLIEERIQKYLDFLNGNCVNQCDCTDYKIQLKKSHSLTIFQLKSSDSITRDMNNLIRQEDERGGEKPFKKLKKGIRQFRNSRNIFNEKYSNIIRKIAKNEKAAEKPRANVKNSLEKIFISKFKNQSVSESFIQIDCRTPSCSPSFINFSRAIIRSISDDTAGIKSTKKHTKSPYAIPSSTLQVGEYQYSTQSSPNIATDKSDSYMTPTAYPVLQYFQQEKHKLNIKSDNYSQDGATLQSLSSVNTSLSSVFTSVNYNINEFSKSMDFSALNFTNVRKGVNAKPFDELYNLRQTANEFKITTKDRMILQCGELPTLAGDAQLKLSHLQHQTFSKSQSLPCILESETKLKFSKKPQPGKATGYTTSSSKKHRVGQFISHDNLKTNDILFVGINDMEHLRSSKSLEFESHFPVLKICPSTPIERGYSTNLLFYQNNDTKQCCNFPIEHELIEQSLNRSICKLSLQTIPSDHCVDKRFTNPSKSSLLAPSISLSRIKHHRSLQEIDSASKIGTLTIGTIDNANVSNNSKPLTSSALAFTTTAAGMAGTPGICQVNRTKLSLSPSKTGMPLDNTTHSENSAPSTAATARDVPEIYRRSSDSDLSITPKGI